jgi:septum formation protein
MNSYSVPLILASSSITRKQLLEEAGYPFTVKIPNVDETSLAEEDAPPTEHAEKLASAKAQNIAEDYPNALVIGADTIVDLKGQVIGKPKDEKDAKLMLEQLSGSIHKVITGLALIRLNANIKIVKSESTIIHPKKMTSLQIDELIKSGLWHNKSGACSIEDVGQFVEKIEGSLTNVMGLPMELLQEQLAKLNTPAE